jgi:2-polyprenyl-6-methoxyphenol hydroxylase-like FAD-dependent oxidoreductase
MNEEAFPRMAQEYDVIIVGGRPAGASLAIRLGAAGVRTLVVDRASQPSLPTVPSSPALHSGTMKLLDELGLEEEAYAHPTARVEAAVLLFDGYFRAVLPAPECHGRRHSMGVERDSFDLLLWQRLADFPSVERREGVHFTDVIRDAEGRVSGVTLSLRGGDTQRIRARWVIGADGRYSRVAQSVGAALLDDRSEHTSTVYYANWTGVRPAAPEATQALVLVTNLRGTSVLFFPMPEGRVSVNTQTRADLAEHRGDAQAFYASVLESLPAVRPLLDGARQVNDVTGIKRIANRILQPSGQGWSLVGDAFHCKDPLDGQGIYDALLESKILAPWIVRNLKGECDAASAERGYSEEVLAAVRPMFEQTCARLKEELYGNPPTLIVKTVMRWCLTDPTYQNRFYRMIQRDVDVDSWKSGGLMLRAMARGLWRDLRGG